MHNITSVATTQTSQWQSKDSATTSLPSERKCLNFNICRMPVGANDFSRDWYSAKRG
jgi:hypothetical protein